jgi:hypothetical protein
MPPNNQAANTSLAWSSVPQPDREHDLARRVLAYASDRDYTGWDYADGMSSRILGAIPVDNRWLNLAFQEGIKRSPINLRRLFLVEQRRSFTGAGLFALAHHALETGPIEDRTVDHAGAVVSLAEWLVENRCRGYAGFCGGHRHQNQHWDHKTYPSEPDVVATGYGVKGLLAAANHRPRFGEVARTATDFLFEDMNYREVEDGAKIDYYPKDTAEHYTLNAGAIAARTLLDIHERFPQNRLRRRARRLLDYVVARQTDRGGWYYRDPPSSSHLSMDTHHNGFVLECLQRHRAVTGSDRYAESLAAGVEFFRETLFEDDGAPKWDESSSHPRDVHAAAQGILVFAGEGHLAFARDIIDWTLEDLYAGDGQFYVRKGRYYTKRITLMRWCQAWMAHALSSYYLAASPERTDLD